MDKYAVLETLGEGSFGRVYKAKQTTDGAFVALKVISKRGRSENELKGFRRECKIQRDLHHPNVIQMIDSFETDNEIVVITEFASSELTALLRKHGFLPEDRVQKIVWDLVSALHYLHSNRVLHRDLKPQNILIDKQNRAKLCDFGFARNMSTGTHVLTSIKGTPLYMAPELIDEKPYDYNADLWSLGCIIYELLMGIPPFSTTSILSLIKMIQRDQIQWPLFLSDNCISFLKGLLQKDPTKRMNWDEILSHPFIKGHIYINYKSSNLTSLSSNDKHKTDRKVSSKDNGVVSVNINVSNDLLQAEGNPKPESRTHTNTSQNIDDVTKTSLERIDVKCDFIEDTQPIEMEEWIVFLQHSMQEIINGEPALLLHSNQTNVLVKLLRNPNASATVLIFVLKLLSIPFVCGKITKDSLPQIRKTYTEIKLVPNLVYAVKLIFRKHCSGNLTEPTSPNNTPSPESFVDPPELSIDDLKALESIFLLICYLVHQQDDLFLLQFCDAVVVLSVYKLINFLLLISPKQDARIVSDVLAILTHLLKRFPEHINVIEQVLAPSCDKQISFVDLLRNSDPRLRERSCYFIYFLGTNSENLISTVWNALLKETLEALMYDSIEAVRIAAEMTVNDLKTKDFYNSFVD